jgi:hypothetical protein
VRRARSALNLAEGEEPPRATVVLRGGTHSLRETLQLGAHDSHMTFQAFPGEDATVSGAVPVTAKWTKAAAPKRDAYEWKPGAADAQFILETGTAPAPRAPPPPSAISPRPRQTLTLVSRYQARCRASRRLRSTAGEVVCAPTCVCVCARACVCVCVCVRVCVRVCVTEHLPHTRSHFTPKLSTLTAPCAH